MPSIIEAILGPVGQPKTIPSEKSCPAALQAGEKTALLDYLCPIMARLPSIDSQEEEIDFADDYFSADSNITIPGTLEYTPHHKNVRYTRSRLPGIDEAATDLWASLHSLRPLTTSYAGNFQCRARTHARNSSNQSACPMKRSSPTSLDLVRRVFNWNDLLLSEHTDAVFYGVIFRSKRSNGSDTEQLMQADKLSHEEAVTSGGLLMYWYGVPDPSTGSNLATCIWSSRDEARKASALPLHRMAAKLATKAYDDFELSRYKVVKKGGETGISIEDWDE